MLDSIHSFITEKRRLREQVRRLMNQLEQEREEMRSKLESVERGWAQTSQHYKTLQAQLEKARTERALAWPKPERRMKEADVLAEFDVPIEEPWFVAVNQELDDAISDVLDEVTQAPSATLTTERRTHLAGGAEALREFQKRLISLRHRAENTDAEMDDALPQS